MTNYSRLHVIVSGRVQGVFFRQKTKEKAQQLGLTGWIKNLPDGRVEAIFEGEEEKIKEILSFLKKGPKLAKVENVETKWETFQNEFNSFKILY